MMRLLAALLSLVPFMVHATERPNVLLILTDNQGFHELSCHGHPTVQTPHIDAFAGQAVDFRNFHAPTYCSPSRGTLLTGKYSLRLGIHNTIGGVSILPAKEKTLAHHLSEAGYATGIFGKWHLGMSVPHGPGDRGFQRVFIHGGGGIGQMEDAFGNNHLDDQYWDQGRLVPTEGFSSDVIFDQAKTFISQTAGNGDKPFFAFVSTPATHSPWKPHPTVAKRIEDRLKAEGKPVPKKKELALFSMIENIDDNVGAILAHLDTHQLTQNTLVIFATDQGMSNRGSVAGHSEFPPVPGYDARNHVFYMLRFPPLTKKPGPNSAITGMVDVCPTVLDLCGLPLPDGIDGRSQRPLLAGASAWADDRVLLLQCPRGRERAKWKNARVKTQRWRLTGGGDGPVLHDVETKMSGVNDEHPDVVVKLSAAYDAFWESLPPATDLLSRHLLGDRPTRLCAMDWYQGGHPWNAGHFKKPGLGTWAVEVEAPGTYRIELRRYPREANRPVGAASAEIRLGGLTSTAKVSPEATYARFELPLLTPGRFDLDAVFTAEDGKPSGACFAYIRRLQP